MEDLREENIKLRKELEQIKNKIGPVSTPMNKKETFTQAPNYSVDLTFKKGKRVKDKEKEKSVSRVKRNSQPAITPLDSKNKSKKIRRELSYSIGDLNIKRRMIP